MRREKKTQSTDENPSTGTLKARRRGREPYFQVLDELSGAALRRGAHQLAVLEELVEMQVLQNGTQHAHTRLLVGIHTLLGEIGVTHSVRRYRTGLGFEGRTWA